MLIGIRKTIRTIIDRLYNKVFPLKSAPFLLKNKNGLKVGKYTFHNGSFSIRGNQQVTIGSYGAIGKNVTLFTVNHDYNYPSIQGFFYSHHFSEEHPGVCQFPPNKARTKGPIVIGNDVWIADGVAIMSGVVIGDGVCIANGSTITRDVPDYAIVAGTPAKIISFRYPDYVIKHLKELKWWLWTEGKIKENYAFFSTNLNEIDKERFNKLLNQIEG